MRWWHQLRRHARQIAGSVLLLVGFVLVLAWVQTDDPEPFCGIFSDFFLQPDSCEGEFRVAAPERINPLLVLIVGCSAFVAGAYLLASGNTAKAPDDADSEQ